MIYLWLFILCIGVVALETVFFPAFGLLPAMYDPGIVLVLYAGLSRPVGEGIFLVVLLGGCMDTLSGAPMGLYLTFYLWFYVVIRAVILFLRPTSIILRIMALALGIVIQNVLLLIPVVISGGLAQVWDRAYPAGCAQVGLGLVSGVYLMKAVDLSVQAWQSASDHAFGRRNTPDGRLR